MKIQITRTDPLANACTDSHEPGVLSVEKFDTWQEVFASLRDRGIPLTAAHEAEFRAHSDTQFSWNEFVNGGVSAYQCNVGYDVRVI